MNISGPQYHSNSVYINNDPLNPVPPRIHSGIVIKLPAMGSRRNIPNQPLRRSSRHSNSSASQPSGSEYHASEKSMSSASHNESVHPTSPDIFTTSHRGRSVRKTNYRESTDDEMGPGSMFDDNVRVQQPQGPVEQNGQDEEEGHSHLRYKTRSQAHSNRIESDDEGNAGVRRPIQPKRAPKRRPPHNGKASSRGPPPPAPTPAKRITRRSAQQVQQDDDYVDDQDHSNTSADADGEPDEDASNEDHPNTPDEVEEEGDLEVGRDQEDELQVGKHDGKYAFRQRRKINYAIPPPLEDMRPKGRSNGGRAGGRSGHGHSRKGPGWSATGAELGRWMGMPPEDSDSDYGTRTPRKPFVAGAAGGGFLGGAMAGSGMLPSDLAAAAGTPSNLGKIGDAALADADPLGVNANVTFDEVGGLDDHIHSLKEMTLLPLLYPEVFQRFNVTPPRGVLFHGPPGTGKTLLARALAASCRANGKQISFFMRKGADCLSKWVGEAERQLRLLFEEAKNCQPSIIFFDEIDGLAPVRSSKQDQIHASIVSTLLALMDGMDGRGQVIVIGATNRPDAIDPALRRPGRFDREFYFPLPGLPARERILEIMTKGWDGWEGEKGIDNRKCLAKMTKGYGGADLRALCTEAALNAVQRRYPQIYKSNDRLLLAPETIHVGLRDFMISIKKLVPSSARSSTSSASPLPSQFVPILSDALERVKSVIEKVLPVEKKRSALEEAEWEDEGEEEALDRDLMMQSMETLRVYRPRLILHGPIGMGQSYVGAAALHHLEGYHIQSLELGGLLGDSTRTVEAAIVQLFVEAKRHQPSVIYMPSLIGWCATVSETSRSTVRAMLDTLAPTDPILFLAVVDGPFSGLPRDVRSWFGPSLDNRVELQYSSSSQREEFFGGLLADIGRPPNEFPDGVKRKKRVLEELPIAPPLEPRQPTAAEIALQEENDKRVIILLQYRLGPILTELKRKFKRFTKKATEEYAFEFMDERVVQSETITQTVEVVPDADGVAIIVDQEQTNEQVVNGLVDGDGQAAGVQLTRQATEMMPSLYDVDLEKMHADLYKGKYLTPQDFLGDISKIVYNAEMRMVEDPERLYKAHAMLTAAQVSINDLDPQLKIECDRMAGRERKRREEHKKKNKVKGKEPEDGANPNEAYAPGTRRSARNNGQQPEISITDPSKLERRLKRQRAQESSTDLSPSEEENNDTRTPKRSKVVVDDDPDQDDDPLDIVGPTSSQPRPLAVRFADDVESPGLPDASRIRDRTPEPQNMLVDSFPRTSGFDPSLLNPLSPPANELSPNNPVSHPSPSFPSPSDPFTTPVRPDFMQQLPPDMSPPRTPVRIAGPSELLPVLEDLPLPIIVDRPPTPHPPFHLDEDLLQSLRQKLRDDTFNLNVEQLEQLRATCLGCIWRHRSEWDRDQVVQELVGIVDQFIREVEWDEE